MPTYAPDDDFLPSASLDILKWRSRCLKFVRGFFEEHGYWEVQTPVLSHDVVIDAHLDPFATTTDGGEEESPGSRLYLQTSPEFAMKRLLAAGAEAIYQIGPVMRRGEQGRLHNPEFTMLEWYRLGETHVEQMRFVEEFVRAFFTTSRKRLKEFVDDGPSPVPRGDAFDRFTYDTAFETFAGTRVLGKPVSELVALARSRGVNAPASLDRDDRDGWLNLLLVALVEPHLGRERPAFLFDYPASQAALAKTRGEVAERFELYVDGMEVCNGYHELTDAEELRRRNRRQSTIRRRQGLRPLPEESRLLRAMQSGLPACTGVALGLDRLLMLAAGRSRLAEVMPFPIERA